MLTITITPRAVLLTAAFALASFLAFYATDALGSDTPGSILQGDTNCDGDVDSQDALNELRYIAGLDVDQSEPCPDVGAVAVIPGPQGPQGPQGVQGPPGLSDVERVAVAGSSTSNLNNSAVASCPGGKTLIGGGGEVGQGGLGVAGIVGSSPGPSGTALENSWGVFGYAYDTPTEPWSVLAWAICANVSE
jgi:hypothetical protein